MNNMNLLPREPRIQRLFAPLLLIVAIGWISTATAFIYLSFETKIKSDELRRDTSEIGLRTFELQRERRADPLAAEYESLRVAIDGLNHNKRKWVPVLQSIMSGLPNDAEMNSLQASGDSEISANFIFKDMGQVAAYVSRLEHDPLFERIHIRGITRIGSDQQPSGGTSSDLSVTSKLQVVLEITLNGVK